MIRCSAILMRMSVKGIRSIVGQKSCISPMTTLRHGEARPPFNMPMPVGWYIVGWYVTSAPSLPSFKRRLKTELFARSYPDSSGRV